MPGGLPGGSMGGFGIDRYIIDFHKSKTVKLRLERLIFVKSVFVILFLSHRSMEY